MVDLATTAAQILDKLSDLVSGPVQGVVTATTTSGSVDVPQGQLGTLADGRIVRVIRGVTVSTTPTTVFVRLVQLTPSFPNTGNHRPVASGTACTWILPPAGLSLTGTTSAFAPNGKATGLRVTGLVEAESLAEASDYYAAGSQGTTNLVLLPPRLRALGGEHEAIRQYFEAFWVVRANIGTMAAQRDRRVLSRTLFEAVAHSLQGATAGDAYVEFQKWEASKPDGSSWDLLVRTWLMVEGRSIFDVQNYLEEFTTDIRLPGDVTQPGPFVVSVDVTGT